MQHTLQQMDNNKVPVLFIRWLQLSMLMVFLMVAIGGLTRLTESGLSIVEWKLVTGILPPLTDEGWHREFEAYKATPEYVKKNNYMALSDFKRIFWLEYLHRLWGRLIGLVFLLPFIYFAVKRNLPSPMLKRSGFLLGLVCLQGAIGWYMVKSGLVHDPWVSPYRLALHLSLAIVIFGLLYWSYKQVSKPVQQNNAKTGGLAFWVLVFIGLQIILGAFVAGLDAGYSYNTFPWMDGQFLPKNLWLLEPWYRNLLEDRATIQFIHRWFAFIVFAAILYQWMRRYEPSALLVVLVALVQVVLGVATLLSVVDITLASLHQLVAMLLVLAQLRHLYHQKSAKLTQNLHKRDVIVPHKQGLPI